MSIHRDLLAMTIRICGPGCKDTSFVSNCAVSVDLHAIGSLSGSGRGREQLLMKSAVTARFQLFHLATFLIPDIEQHVESTTVGSVMMIEA